jgi:hypothetical protein
MKLLNTTAYPAKLMKNISPQNRRMMSCIITRVSYDVSADGRLVAMAEQNWPVNSEPCDTPFGPRGGDKPFYMGGVDVLLGGRVHQPNRRVEGKLDVELEIGRTFRRRLAIFGDRRWLRGKDGSLVASPPETFGSMSLSDSLTFGGRTLASNGQETQYGPNPRGRGYFLDELSAEGQLLPNIEDPNQLVTRYEDRPTPPGIGYYPETGSLRPMAALEHPGLAGVLGQTTGKNAAPPDVPADTSIGPEHLSPKLFNQAHPNMVIPAEKSPQPGDVIRLSHGRKDGSDLLFILPATGFHLHVQLEDRERVVPLHLDQIGIIAGDARVLLSYRVVIDYRLVRHERRVCSLYEGPVPDPIPPRYKRDLRDEWEGDRWGNMENS